MSDEAPVATDVDDLLKVLVSTVNTSPEDGPSITLAVGGMLVSGVMVSADRYFRAVGVAELGHGKGREAAEFFRKPESENPRHIHLRNPRFFLTTSSPPIAQDDQFFRAKLSAVEGFIPGRFEATIVR